MSTPRGREPIEGEVSLDASNLVIKKPISPPVDESSPSPQTGAKVTVHYTGTLEDSSKFDSSRDRGEPFSFTIDQGQVIKGWDIAVKSMKEGERASFWLHSSVAYGERGSPPKIPANAPLVFDIELISFEPDYSSLSSNELIEIAVQEKQAGADKFSSKDLQGAAKHWQRSLDALDNIWPEEEEKELKEQVDTMMKSVQLNLGLVHLKTNNARNAINVLLKVLEVEPNNKKALYRLSMAYFECSDFEEAKKFAEKLIEVDSDSKEGRNMLSKISQAVKREELRQKNMFKKMMSAL
ncbi:hypothetical protein P9112_006645 [Eukaryota sp. TZLM1-RC]